MGREGWGAFRLASFRNYFSFMKLIKTLGESRFVLYFLHLPFVPICEGREDMKVTISDPLPSYPLLSKRKKHSFVAIMRT